jgi:hypothetical protein
MPKGNSPPYLTPLTWNAKGVSEVRLKDKKVDATWLGKLVLSRLKEDEPVIVGLEKP